MDFAPDAGSQSKGMNSKASITCTLVNGASTIQEMVSQPPLTFRNTADGVMIVNTAAGPLGGDRLELSVTVEDGAALTLGGVAAAMALPGSAGTGRSESIISITLGESSRLEWDPQPLILANGAHHKQIVKIQAKKSSSFIYGDAYQFGRHLEKTGRIEQEISVKLDGKTSFMQSMDINPEEDWSEAFTLQGARSFASYISHGVELSNTDEFTELDLENGIRIYQRIGSLLTPLLTVKV